MATVSIVKRLKPTEFEQVRQMVKEAIDLLGGPKQFINQGDTVLIKPCLLLPLDPERAVTTHPLVLQSVVDVIKCETKAGRVLVGDIPRLKLRARDVMKATGIEDAAKKAGAEVVYMDEEEQVEVAVPNGVVLDKTKLPKTVLEVDKIIYVPKLKTHYITKISCAIKAAHGLQSTDERAKYHREDLHHKLVDLLRVVKPSLCVVDALVAMEGQGPVYGDPVELNTIVAGDDPVAVDAVCAYMLGFDPLDIPTTRIAYSDGLGEADLRNIVIKGVEIGRVRRPIRKCDHNIEGVHPKIETFVGGTCVGCLTSSRGFIDGIIKRGWIDELEKITIITGMDIHFGHEPTGEIIFVLGDCAKAYGNKGIFIPGCIPFDSWTLGFEILEKYLKEKRAKRLDGP